MSVLGEEKRKAVLKQVLEDPYLKVAWPEVSEDKRESIFSLLQSALAPVKPYRESQRQAKDTGVKLPPTPGAVEQSSLGFNPVTKALQSQAKQNLLSEPVKEPITMVFICKDDIQPEILVKHFPSLCASASNTQTAVKLVSLPAGSMEKLSEVTGLRDLGCVALKAHKDFDTLSKVIMASVLDVELPWKSESPFTPLEVKSLTTFAPIKKSKNQLTAEKKGKENNQKEQQQKQQKQGKQGNAKPKGKVTKP
ncbi:RNase P subunit Pop3-domain-containing protein [Yarrowia lipolytica]|jgi:ribonuclease P/MRP protein subunit POP3|uniref:YALI0F07447p n=2 Tax=Yarrowia lipolytica TaxID=4952 RepID=Q6C2J3_YARLI|nr:YALI0F07447p [Yarrowia lipolytica CLIB122]AOW06805.1 hypothetical protein YALI1_F10760g [Yarrowia lipolytica]KAB8284124.1 RNase P subunit Pop3-domain-containing protein [Yarrowia lipolytica]KAE8173711.1 RNase P subunit Pop3-domain-containing protein [Yarrowia lipolytica]KAJ8055995.1 RNase P subunit Pop3-domain-containing protein [Yarrowia lipolytica]QNQ00603.1 Hypothetical protein YALI2_F00148g [Yarrowia lipolytica]|eukprot:XP_505119.1 YALI0F07447p [Yarrowia lipolytica CLIB122]